MSRVFALGSVTLLGLAAAPNAHSALKHNQAFLKIWGDTRLLKPNPPSLLNGTVSLLRQGSIMDSSPVRPIHIFEQKIDSRLPEVHAWGESLAGFLDVNRRLGEEGFWLIYRSLKLNESVGAVPHLAALVGDQVYEVINGPLRDSPYPQAKSIEQFVADWKTESSSLGVQNGMFFAQRMAAKVPDAEALAEFYQEKVAKFAHDGDFVYAFEPKPKAGSKNCVTFIMDAFLEPQSDEEGILLANDHSQVTPFLLGPARVYY